jgi:octaprenyl-diphosphate synthase
LAANTSASARLATQGRWGHSLIIDAYPHRAPGAPALNAPHNPRLILAPVAADMQAMDSEIRRRLHSDVALVNQISEYIIGAGGKRLRPALLLLLAGAGGFQGDARITLAAVVEFIHTATLLHDDVVDESTLRRGRETANALFGNAASVLVGDFLYSRAFQMMVEVDDMRVMRTLADATNAIAEGEVLQLLNVHDPDVDEARYLHVIRSKTAKLFEASARLAGILCAIDDAALERWTEFGRRLGTAFQLIDDVLDYSGVTEDIGKNVGDDLREGKPTLPLIYLLERGTAEQRTLVREAITTAGSVDLERMRVEIQGSGALEYTAEMAQREAAAAQAAIADLPNSPHRESLIELCAFAIQRDR